MEICQQWRKWLGPKHHHQHIPQRILLYIPLLNQSQLSKLGDRDLQTYWIGSSRRTVGLKIFIDPRWSIRGRVEPKSWKCVRLCCCSKESSKSGVIGHAYYYIPHLFFLESLSFLLLLYSFSKFLSPLFEPLYALWVCPPNLSWYFWCVCIWKSSIKSVRKKSRHARHFELVI